jgi:hypothetical protein
MESDLTTVARRLTKSLEPWAESKKAKTGKADDDAPGKKPITKMFKLSKFLGE